MRRFSFLLPFSVAQAWCRTEFNLVNRTRFGNPNLNLNSSTFGVITSQANTPRQMQGALKLYW